MSEYKIPLVWEEYGYAWIPTNSKKEAIEIVLGPDCPLPEGTMWMTLLRWMIPSKQRLDNRNDKIKAAFCDRAAFILFRFGSRF